MKRNTLYTVAGVALTALLTLFSCQQEDVLEKISSADETTSRGNEADPVKWEFDTTEAGAGKLDSLLTLRTSNEKIDRNSVNILVISGPLNSEDFSTVAALPYLDSLNIENVTVIDSYGKETKTLSGFYNIQSSTLGILLPKSITTIGSSAFSNGDLLRVVIPENVTTIEYSAFNNCGNLKSITIPDGVTTLGNSIFNYCTSLQKVKLPAGLAGTLPDYAFRGCSALEVIDIPTGISAIGYNTFSGCTNLNLTLHSYIREVGERAFENCTKLTPDLSYLKKIGSYAFQGCSSITTLDIPAGIQEIGAYAFSRIGITSYTAPANIPLGDGMLNECEQLKTLTFSEGVTAIPNDFARDCKALQTVALPASIASIGNSAFYNCSSISGITLPQNLQTIGGSAFYYCSGLQNIELPAGLKTIGSSTFAGTGLKTLTIPASVTSCGYSLVDNCRQLTSVFWNPSIQIPSLRYNTYNLLVYAPAGATSSQENLNLIVDGVAKNIQLSDENGNYSFNCPQAFTAEKVTYARDFYNYQQNPSTGEAARWESIVLPFRPTAIRTRENGSDTYSKELAPFDARQEGQYPFWLRELTANGFTDAAWIEPNKPYIIAMPYNDNYLPEYNINSYVQFYGENVRFEATPADPVPAVGASYSLYPNYTWMEERDDYLTLNESSYYDGSKSLPAGSVFVSNRSIRPFEAYAVSHTPTRSFIPLGETAATRSGKRVVGKVPHKEDM